MADNRTGFQRDLGGQAAEYEYGNQQFKNYVGLGDGPAVNPIARAYGYFADAPQAAAARAAALATYNTAQDPARYVAARDAGIAGRPVLPPSAPPAGPRPVNEVSSNQIRGSVAAMPTGAFGGSLAGIRLLGQGNGIRTATMADGLTKGDVHRIIAENPRARAPTYRDVLGRELLRGSNELYAQERAAARGDPVAEAKALSGHMSRLGPALGGGYYPGSFDSREED